MYYKYTFQICTLFIGHIFDHFSENIPGVEEPIVQVDYRMTIFWVVALLLMIPLINRAFSRLYRIIEDWYDSRFRVVRIQGLEFVFPTRLTNSLIALMKHLRTMIVLTVVFISLIILFNIFPETRGFVLIILEHLSSFFETMADKFMAYLPNLVALITIAVITFYTLKLLRFLSEGIRQEKIKVSGIHPELIYPTFQLLRFLIIAFAIVTAYPYIPGSDSPVFRGVSILVGFLLSLGSTSLVANIVSGVVLTYTRGLRVGDRVEIEDVVGDVVDRNLLVTRIKTIKNVVVTIPNGKVLNNHIVNYSSNAQEKGLILHSTVTIGYDVPWRRINQLLISAALSTEGVLNRPMPFVHQTSLDDYYVTYEINAFTKDPADMARIYSDMHQHIQDKFNEANVEIMSPAYTAYRDGNRPTIPQESQNFGYFADVFRPLRPEDTRPRP
jgi:small-conductance mechanosensitive channel